nr:hypothetical protein [Hymenobacter metallicola]
METIQASRRGVTGIATAAVVLALAGTLGLWLPARVTELVLLGGMGLIFPLGLLVNHVLGIHFFSKANPLGTLSGLVAGGQLLFAPLFIGLYFKHTPQLLLLVGVVAGTQFLVCAWLYSSRTYWFLTIATVGVAYGGSLLFSANSLVLLPWSMAVVCALGVLGLLQENRADQPIRAAADSLTAKPKPVAEREQAEEIRCNPFFELLSSSSV